MNTAGRHAGTGRARVGIVGSHVNRRQGAANVMARLADYGSEYYNLELLAGEVEDLGIEGASATRVRRIHGPSWLANPSLAVGATLTTRKRGFDLVHSHDTFAFGADLYTAHSSFAGYIGARRRSEGLGFNVASRVYPPHTAMLGLSRLTLGRKRSRVVTVSGSVRSELLDAYDLDPTRVSVVYNAVDSDRFALVNRAEARRTMSDLVGTDLSERTVLAFVGHEFGRKRLATVIRALAEADPAGDRTALLVAGGDDPAPYVRLATDLNLNAPVFYLGVRRDIPQVLGAADVFVFPTQYEAASLAILEACAAGLAIVTTRVAMAAEVFEDGEHALLLPNTEDHGPLTNALRVILTSPTKLDDLQVAALAVARRFTWESAWKQYHAIYEELLAEKRFASASR